MINFTLIGVFFGLKYGMKEIAHYEKQNKKNHSDII